MNVLDKTYLEMEKARLSFPEGDIENKKQGDRSIRRRFNNDGGGGFKFVSESNISESLQESRKECRMERYYDALLLLRVRDGKRWWETEAGEARRFGVLYERRGASRWKPSKKWKKSGNPDNRAPLRERQRVSSGEVCWESARERRKRGGKRPSKQFYSDSVLEWSSLCLILLPRCAWRPIETFEEVSRYIEESVYRLGRELVVGWTIGYSVSCYFGAISAAFFVESRNVEKGSFGCHDFFNRSVRFSIPDSYDYFIIRLFFNFVILMYIKMLRKFCPSNFAN